MAIPYTKQMLIERIVKQINSDFPGNDWKMTDNEILIAIDAAIPFVMKGQMFDNFRVNNIFEVPEAYIVGYELTITKQNRNTKEWYTTLPQAPLALPKGYDITDAYFTSPLLGRGIPVIFVTAKRAPYRDQLPKPPGIFARVEGDTIFLKGSQWQSLYNQVLYLSMPVSRTADKDAVMNIPDDAIEPIFMKVVGQILQRFGIPQNTVLDGIPAGNNKPNN